MKLLMILSSNWTEDVARVIWSASRKILGTH
jgi:hypothetical protein